MSYEISRVTDLTPETIHNYTVVSGRANKARYAIAAFKSKLSEIISPENKNPQYVGCDDVIGVDITPSCIYVCQIDNKAAGRTLTSLTSVCMPGKFIGEDILNNPNLYSESLKTLIQEHKIQTKKVAISLPVSSSIVRVATISLMNDEEIAKAIKYGSLWKNLMNQDESPENYSIFYQVIGRDVSCETMEILLVATKLSDINLYKNIVIKSGLLPVVIDAKALAIHYALKNRPIQGEKVGTLLIEFGLTDNYIMAIGDHNPRIFNIDLSEKERAAILGCGANGDNKTIDAIIQKYSRKIHAITYFYNKMNPRIGIDEVYVMSSLPLINSFISKLADSLKNFRVKEYSMLDYLVIEDSFNIKKGNNNNLSAWAGAICMAIFPWNKRHENWIEIQQSPSFGTVYFHHYDKQYQLQNLSIKIGDFEPCYTPSASNETNTKSIFARLPNIIAMAAAVLSIFAVYTSYSKLIEEGKKLSENDIPLSNVVSRYKEKTAELVSISDLAGKLEAISDASENISKENNQQYVLSMYNYLNTVLQQGVWLKELTFNAPDNIVIEGRSLDDVGVMSFLGTIGGSKMFSKMDLKHIQSIKELDLYAQNSTDLKSFIFKGNLSDTLPGEYLSKPNMVAGGMGHGG